MFVTLAWFFNFTLAIVASSRTSQAQSTVTEGTDLDSHAPFSTRAADRLVSPSEGCSFCRCKKDHQEESTI